MFTVLLLVVVAYATNFNTWVANNNKHFTIVESLRRRAIFNNNARFIAKFNKNNSFKLSVEGPFAAMTEAEYNSMLKPFVIDEQHEEIINDSMRDAPESVDWRAQGKVPAIRDQASCGSCYSFASVAAIEGRLLVAGSKKFTVEDLDLSEQQLVDCSVSVGNKGCNGGSLLLSFRYVKLNGIMQEKDYPYVAAEETCTYDKKKVAVKITGQKLVRPGSEKALMRAAAEGPVAAAIDASGVKFQLYKSGIYNSKECSSTQLNHGVAVVGYGTQNGTEYWIVRNSWGTIWGDQGYVLMSRNKNNQCGIASGAAYPVGVADA
ncbi:hypothetical protein ENUP19_0257G0034 [Entamoeba nuttalli]|uniref:Cysteine proteinase, putative n=2 Tax=Entamoeba nuttalli TaxID=412467 RepID=K2G776_ENTNP|nr:cysteine proteinase, putative [Entamoeba nuttalli P19]EKE38251.1 cysteine proteinase, putative [Entamoeba nuttalli P19]|eukprot:XP_008859403.1 cysteine proteinase, putative [Entamoeba nuttalli P19]